MTEAMMLDRIVEVFFEVDDFCKAFGPQWEASLIGTGGPARRGPEPGLSPSEIITLLLVFHSSGFKYLKSFYHGFAEPLLRGYFPGMPCYEHFVTLQKRQPFTSPTIFASRCYQTLNRFIYSLL